MSKYKNNFYLNREVFRRDKCFLGLEDNLSDFETADTVVLPVPYDATTSIKTGTRNGPEAIVGASYLLEVYDEEIGVEPCETGIHTLNEMEPDLRGPDKMVDRIYDVYKQILADKKFVMMLGGEHTVSVGAVRALKEKYPDLSILQIDAHTDLRDDYEGTPFNHACAARRMIEYAPITQVGIRCVAPEERANIEKFKGRLNIFYAYDVNLEFSHDADWVEKAVSGLSDHVYLTIDLDGLDPSIMPAVGTPLPGGLGYYQVLNLVKQLCSKKTLVGADLVELCPLTDDISANYLAAKLAYKILGYRQIGMK